MNDLGYTKNLFILPFDHRSSFEKAGFEDIPNLKQIIYEAFKKSLGSVAKESGAILVDEQYGEAILKDAKENSYTILLTIEKSGKADFVFEYGEDFGTHIEKYNPNFAKALIRVSRQARDRSSAGQNGVTELSKINLKKLSEYCHTKNFKFLLEVLADGNLDLILSMIQELQSFGIEPDVWKIEGMENSSDYEKIISQIRSGGRDNVSLVILGRGEEEKKVEEWIKAGRNVPGVIGFAVGRTVFWEPLVKFNNGKMSREEAINMISENFIHFYKLFIGS